MKTIKAIVLIILGSFFIATGFAFAGGSEAAAVVAPTSQR